MPASREPGRCPAGHKCEVNGIFIQCLECGWIDDSTMADLYASQGFQRVAQ